MITRIVRLSFDPQRVDDFKKLFYASQPHIEQMPGCKKVDLFLDSALPNVFYTLSLWQNENALNDYRNSALFRETWSKTKAMFNDKPQAWSLLPQMNNTI